MMSSMPTNEQGSWTGQAGRLNDDGYIRRACPQRVPQGSPPEDCIAHTINTGNQVRVKHIHHHTYTTRDTRTSIRKPARHSNQSTYGLLTHTHNTQPQLGKKQNTEHTYYHKHSTQQHTHRTGKQMRSHTHIQKNTPTYTYGERTHTGTLPQHATGVAAGPPRASRQGGGPVCSRTQVGRDTAQGRARADGKSGVHLSTEGAGNSKRAGNPTRNRGGNTLRGNSEGSHHRTCRLIYGKGLNSLMYKNSGRKVHQTWWAMQKLLGKEIVASLDTVQPSTCRDKRRGMTEQLGPHVKHTRGSEVTRRREGASCAVRMDLILGLGFK